MLRLAAQLRRLGLGLLGFGIALRVSDARIVLLGVGLADGPWVTLPPPWVTDLTGGLALLLIGAALALELHRDPPPPRQWFARLRSGLRTLPAHWLFAIAHPVVAAWFFLAHVLR